jgi:hypothetical protein
MPIQGWVKPGQPLGYMQLLKARGLWPPAQVHVSQQRRDERPATGFIVLPASAGDKGARPGPGISWLDSGALRLMNVKTHAFEDNPRLGQSYRVAATVENLGAAPVLGGFAEFHVADPIWIDNKKLHFNVGNPLEPPRWLGVTAFSLPIGKARTVQSPKSWTPKTDTDLNAALLVQAFDPFGDKLTAEWDSWRDRHVARRDLAPNFAGSWKGTETNDATHANTGPVAIKIAPISSMMQKAAFKPDGSYPGGNFETAVTVQSLAAIAGRQLTLQPVSNVQYQRGSLTWILYSTNGLDQHATRCDFKLTQMATGQLHLSCRWGPNLTVGAGSSHATLSPA